MTPTRGFVRITVVRPHDEIDVTAPHDADPSEIVRVCLSDGWASTGEADSGWVLEHPLAGVLGALDGGVDLQEGDVVYLRPRTTIDLAPAVDDVAEVTRGLVGRPSAAIETALVTFGVLVAPTAAVVLALLGGDITFLVGLAVLVPLVWLVLDREGPAADVASAASVGAGGVGAAALALPHGVGAAAAAGLLTAFVCALGVGFVVGDVRRCRGLWAIAAAGLVAAGTVGAERVIGEQSAAVTLLAGLGLAWAATSISMTTSGLAALDARVAAGDAVPEGDVARAVERASTDLHGLAVVSALAVLVGAGSAAGLGGAASGLVVAVGVALACRARLLVRPRHAVPLAAGGGLAVATAVIVPLAAHDVRAVPALVVGAVVLAAAWASAARAAGAVSVSRARRVIDRVDRIALLSVPLWVAGVFGLYGVVWDAV